MSSPISWDVNGFDDVYASGMSNCCGAPVYDDMDICSDCGEHCARVEICKVCNGTGEVDVLDDKAVRGWTISPPYKKIKCENCNEGWVEE